MKPKITDKVSKNMGEGFNTAKNSSATKKDSIDLKNYKTLKDMIIDNDLGPEIFQKLPLHNKLNLLLHFKHLNQNISIIRIGNTSNDIPQMFLQYVRILIYGKITFTASGVFKKKRFSYVQHDEVNGTHYTFFISQGDFITVSSIVDKKKSMHVTVFKPEHIKDEQLNIDMIEHHKNIIEELGIDFFDFKKQTPFYAKKTPLFKGEVLSTIQPNKFVLKDVVPKNIENRLSAFILTVESTPMNIDVLVDTDNLRNCEIYCTNSEGIQWEINNTRTNRVSGDIIDKNNISHVWAKTYNCIRTYLNTPIVKEKFIKLMVKKYHNKLTSAEKTQLIDDCIKLDIVEFFKTYIPYDTFFSEQQPILIMYDEIEKTSAQKFYKLIGTKP